MKMFKRKLISSLIYLQLFGITANATILWAGSEDVDFPDGLACTTVGINRTNFARASVYACTASTISKGRPFSGGSVTSVWISAQYRPWNSPAGSRWFGFGKSGTNNGILLGSDNGNMFKIALWKYDGTTWTNMISESGASLSNGPIFKLDMQILNYGTNGTVNVYLNQSNSPVLTYTGDLTAGGNTGLDSVWISGGNSSSAYSEIIASTTDTRLMSLVALTPNAAGDTSQWTGAYTDIDETVYNDSDNIASSASGDVFQCNLSGLPAGTFSVLGVKIGARATNFSAAPTSIALGVKTNGAVSLQSAVTQLPVWSYMDTPILTTNPVTSTDWTPTDINNLQISVQSAP
ncbi:MAG: hypothetical protein ACXVCP_12695 [Bdellovibrio sp.]